jgi:hypothetical protein
MAQVVKRLPSKHEALSSNPSTVQKRKEKNITKTYFLYFSEEGIIINFCFPQISIFASLRFSN